MKRSEARLFLRLLLSLTLCSVLPACALESAHENFNSMMERQVNRSIDDPNTLTNRYPEDMGARSRLSNGNIEQTFRFRAGCQVYFEIDKASQKIVNWRYEGTEQDCVLVP